MCGATLRVEVKDRSIEWARRLAGRLKPESLGKVGGSTPMLHEEWILELPSPGAMCNVHSEVIKGMQAARSCAGDMLAKAQLTCFGDICRAFIAPQFVINVIWAVNPFPC